MEPFLRFDLKGEEEKAWLNSTKNPGKWAGNAWAGSAMMMRASFESCAKVEEEDAEGTQSPERRWGERFDRTKKILLYYKFTYVLLLVARRRRRPRGEASQPYTNFAWSMFNKHHTTSQHLYLCISLIYHLHTYMHSKSIYYVILLNLPT